MSDQKVLTLIPQVTGTEPGEVVAIYPKDTMPLGMEFLKDIPVSEDGTSTNTTATLSITLGPDTDTDPADTDRD